VCSSDLIKFDIGIPGLTLDLSLEIKTKFGQLHGRQKLKKASWAICRSPEEIMAAIQKAKKVAEKIKEAINAGL
jgi:hypothetical protein